MGRILGGKNRSIEAFLMIFRTGSYIFLRIRNGRRACYRSVDRSVENGGGRVIENG
jgi:hypothetical protein